MKATLRIVGCLCAIAVLIPHMQAQEGQWQSLAQVRPGTKIQVVEKSLKSVSGALVAVSETGLTMTAEGKQVVVPREQIYRVSVSGKNRKRNILVGLAIGAGVGVGIGAATRNVVNDNKIIPLEGLAMAGVGAGVGAVVPANRNVYKAEVPTQASGGQGAADRGLPGKSRSLSASTMSRSVPQQPQERRSLAGVRSPGARRNPADRCCERRKYALQDICDQFLGADVMRADSAGTVSHP